MLTSSQADPSNAMQGAIFLAVIASGFTWPTIENMGPKHLAALQVFWYSSLMLSIAAVAVAVHQSVFLARLASIPNHEEVLVQMLTYADPNGRRLPRQEQTFIWLLAVALLEWGLAFWLGGYAVFIWDVTKVRQKHQTGLNIMVSPTCTNLLSEELTLPSRWLQSRS
jgi:hypothetical protein